MRALLLAVVLAVPAPAQTPAVPVAEENAQKARVSIQRAIAALGGEAYLKLQDMSQEGRTYGFSQGEPRGTGAKFWRFWKWPDKDRLELTKDRDWVLIYNGEQGWESTFRGTSEMGAAELADYLRRREHSLERVLRTWLDKPGLALFHDGTSLVEQRLTEQVTLMDAERRTVTLFLDANSHLPIKKSFTWRDTEHRATVEEGEVYGNYRLIQGIQTPHIVTRTRNGLPVNQRFIDQIRYNTGLADTLFTARVGEKK